MTDDYGNGMQAEYGPSTTETAPGAGPPPQVDEATTRFVKMWCERIRRAEKYYEDGAFKRMRESQQMATFGAPKEWITAGCYVAPIIPRHINLAVAQLYAKNPTVVAKPRKKLMFRLWDGDPASIQAALQSLQAALAPAVDPMTGAEIPGPMAEPDPNAVALLQEVQAVKQEELIRKKIGKTLELSWNYFTSEQVCGFKQQLKMLVRRTKTNGVGWLDLGYQRVMGESSDVTAKIADTQEQIQKVECLLKENAEGEIPENSPKLEELRQTLAALQAEPEIVVREGPVFGFLRSTDVIVDTACVHLKTMAGADWAARKLHMTPERVYEVFKVRISGYYSEYRPRGGQENLKDSAARENPTEPMACLYRVQQKSTGLEFTICEGYPGYIKPPASPEVKIDRFFTLFPLVFNEVDHEDEIIPPSDAWNARHAQKDYNRAREGLREHRQASRPGYATAKDALEQADKEKLESRESHAIVELSSMLTGEKVADKLQALPTISIDPNLYEVGPQRDDVLLSVGSQEANLGPTSDSTATEASIAENSRSAGLADNVDDLDDFLTDLARATGQLMLLELAPETVMEIAGPGAVWPQLSREQISKEIELEIQAGSSGRPNKAAELADTERGMPYILQLPGINPAPIGRKYAELLGWDVDELIVEGLPSITALNAMASKPPSQPAAAGGGAEDDPNAQGEKGSQNAPNPQRNEPGAQPAMPPPMAIG